MNKLKHVVVFGGGTINHIANHLAISAPAYGVVSSRLMFHLGSDERYQSMNLIHYKTKMAGGTHKSIETTADLQRVVDEVVANPMTKIVFFTCAVADYEPNSIEGMDVEFGKGIRLDTHTHPQITLKLTAADKIVRSIRKTRKDIFLVAFKSTCNASKQEMYEKGLRLCKEASCNLVLVNDTVTKFNMIITPEEAAYHETYDRDDALVSLIDMAWFRSHLTFTQSTVVEGTPVPWQDPRVPNSLRVAVDHCINGNAYKPFNGATVGHFAVKLSDTEFLTSIRRSDFNKLNENGLVYVRTDGPDTVIAYGAKPSVGGQSQRIIFNDHAGMDCVLHFHSPLKENHVDKIPVVSQREVECGSMQCGKQTSEGLKQFGNLKAVMLDQHGPNIVFSRDIDPKEVIEFIDANFDLTKKTGGYNI